MQVPVWEADRSISQAQAPTPSASNYSGIQRPKPVESNVKPVEINIPDFLKNPRR